MTESEIFDQFVNKVRIECQGGIHHWITWENLNEQQREEWRKFAGKIIDLVEEFKRYSEYY